jgi:hypothetical protein
MIPEAVPPDVTQFTVQYERLRSQVAGAVTPQPNPLAQQRGVGLALLLREGMPGWLKEVETVIRASPAPRAADAPESPVSEPSDANSAAPAPLPDVARRDLTALLANLVLSARLHQGHQEGDIHHVDEQ